MLVAEKIRLESDMFENTTADELTAKQLEAIKKRAIQLWTEDKWLGELVKAYSKVDNVDPQKGRYTLVKRIFETNTCNIASMNTLLLAVNCRFQMVCYSEPVVLDIY